MDKNYFSVGELSQITGVSSQAIRYYHKIGLLKPAKVEINAYRYYEPIHILYLNTIMRLSQLGCSLQEIKQFLTENDLQSVNSMLQFRKTLTEKKLDELNLSLKALENQIEMIEGGMQAKKTCEIIIKNLPERYYIYEQGFDDLTIKKAIIQVNKLVRKLNQKGLLFVGNPVFEFSLSQSLNKTGFFLADNIQTGGFGFDILSAGKYACIFNYGTYDHMPETVDKLLSYLKEKGINAESSIYQLFLIDYALTQREEELITEIQIKINSY